MTKGGGFIENRYQNGLVLPGFGTSHYIKETKMLSNNLNVEDKEETKMPDTTLAKPKITQTAVHKSEDCRLSEETIALLAEAVRLIADCQYIRDCKLQCWHSYRCIQKLTCEHSPQYAKQPEVVMPVPTQNQAPTA